MSAIFRFFLPLSSNLKGNVSLFILFAIYLFYLLFYLLFILFVILFVIYFICYLLFTLFVIYLIYLLKVLTVIVEVLLFVKQSFLRSGNQDISIQNMLHITLTMYGFVYTCSSLKIR